MSCIFCEIAAKKSPASVVYEDDAIIAFMGIFAHIEGGRVVFNLSGVPAVERSVLNHRAQLLSSPDTQG